MRTLAVCLLLAWPASVAASERPHTSTDPTPGRVTRAHRQMLPRVQDPP